MKWLRQAISDQDGLADMAYIAIGALTCSAIFALAFIFTMSAISYARCGPITTISKGDQSVTSVIPCNFDPLPVGQAAGLIFGAFGALIGALAGYMAATRRASAKTTTTETGASKVTTTEPMPTATVAAPMPVAIVSPDPVPTQEVPAKKPTKPKAGR